MRVHKHKFTGEQISVLQGNVIGRMLWQSLRTWVRSDRWRTRRTRWMSWWRSRTTDQALRPSLRCTAAADNNHNTSVTRLSA